MINVSGSSTQNIDLPPNASLLPTWQVLINTQGLTGSVNIRTSTGSIIRAIGGSRSMLITNTGSSWIYYSFANNNDNLLSISPAGVIIGSSLASMTLQVGVGASNTFTLQTTDPLGVAKTAFSVDDLQRILTPLQPCFSAYKATASANNVTGDGTPYNYICDTVIYNVGSHYNSGTGVFTAPVTGKYSFRVFCAPTNLSSTDTLRLRLITGNRNYLLGEFSAANMANNAVLFGGTVLEVDMDAGDTAYPEITVWAGIKNKGVLGQNDLRTRLQGRLNG